MGFFAGNRKGTKRDFSTTILEWKKVVNHLVVDEAINDDNSVVFLHLEKAFLVLNTMKTMLL